MTFSNAVACSCAGRSEDRLGAQTARDRTPGAGLPWDGGQRGSAGRPRLVVLPGTGGDQEDWVRLKTTTHGPLPLSQEIIRVHTYDLSADPMTETYLPTEKEVWFLHRTGRGRTEKAWVSEVRKRVREQETKQWSEVAQTKSTLIIRYTSVS